MKKIVSNTTVVLSVILIVISICSVSSIDCLKGLIPFKNAIIYTEDIMYNIVSANMRGLSYKLVPLFYVGLILMFLSSIIRFTKTDKFKGLINVALSITTVLFVIITHNYLWFLILINLYLITTLIIDFTLKDKVIIIGNIIGIIIFILNIIQLIQHLQLTFNPIDIQTFQIELVKISDTTLKFFALWLIPHTILIVKDIILTHKTSRTVN